MNKNDLQELLLALQRPQVLNEAAMLAGCLLVAYLVVRLLRGRSRPEASIWFGTRVVDGVLFPVLALSLAYLVKVLLAGTASVAVFKVAIPILLSLVVIRLSTRVLTVSFPNSRSVQLIERTLSWMVWIAVIFWLTGLLPLVLQAMEDVS